MPSAESCGHPAIAAAPIAAAAGGPAQQMHTRL